MIPHNKALQRMRIRRELLSLAIRPRRSTFSFMPNDYFHGLPLLSRHCLECPGWVASTHSENFAAQDGQMANPGQLRKYR